MDVVSSSAQYIFVTIFIALVKVGDSYLVHFLI